MVTPATASPAPTANVPSGTGSASMRCCARCSGEAVGGGPAVGDPSGDLSVEPWLEPSLEPSLDPADDALVDPSVDWAGSDRTRGRYAPRTPDRGTGAGLHGFFTATTLRGSVPVWERLTLPPGEGAR